jgi:predicted TIM-barrel fold metal-dependent hydrolase
MLTQDTLIISADDHIIEHPDVWQSRLPKRFLESGPRIVEVDGGTQRWIYEGKPAATVDGATGLSALAGVNLDERTRDPGRFENMRKGCSNAAARLEDMDVDGVFGQVCFPSFARFSGTRFLRGSDHELGLACVRAYNDFVLEEWHAVAPDRFVPLIILPLWDRQLCVAEIERCAARGARAITFTENPALIGLPAFGNEEWDPVFSAATAAGMPLCLHFGSSGVTPQVAPNGPAAVAAAVMGPTLFGSMTDLVFSSTLHKHPGLKVVYAESGIGWVPHAIQRLDQVWSQYRHYKVQPTINFHVPPSELIRDHIFVCVIDDPVGIEMRHKIGVDNILYESDYPHSDSVWPNSRKVLDGLLKDVPEDEARKIASGNAQRLFGFGGKPAAAGA